jgi:hypothetical protein
MACRAKVATETDSINNALRRLCSATGANGHAAVVPEPVACVIIQAAGNIPYQQTRNGSSLQT